MFLFCPHSYTGFVISFYINGLCLTNINLPHSVRDACQSGRCLLDLTFNVFFSCIVFGTADIFTFLSPVPLQYSFLLWPLKQLLEQRQCIKDFLQYPKRSSCILNAFPETSGLYSRKKPPKQNKETVRILPASLLTCHAAVRLEKHVLFNFKLLKRSLLLQLEFQFITSDDTPHKIQDSLKETFIFAHCQV